MCRSFVCKIWLLISLKFKLVVTSFCGETVDSRENGADKIRQTVVFWFSVKKIFRLVGRLFSSSFFSDFSFRLSQPLCSWFVYVTLSLV